MRKRYVVIAMLAIPLLALSWAWAAENADPAAGDPYDACARACNDCQRMCDMCSAYCGRLLADGKAAHLMALQTCQDCATHCSAAACIVARHGPFSDTICKACAEACKRCGDECAKFTDDETMKKCADECRACEKACRDMLSHITTT
ncbi:MAG: four-helix bundle copper-binding protein [Thermoguttaceae bacterium]